MPRAPSPRRKNSSGVSVGGCTRPARRGARVPQGSLRHARPPHDGRVPAVPGSRPGGGLRLRGAPAGSGCDPRREDEHPGVRDVRSHLQPAPAGMCESLGPDPYRGRLERRRGSQCGGWDHAASRGQRFRGVDAGSPPRSAAYTAWCQAMGACHDRGGSGGRCSTPGWDRSRATYGTPRSCCRSLPGQTPGIPRA